MLEGLRWPSDNVRNATRNVIILGGVLLLSSALALEVAYRYVAEELDREVSTWQARLGVLADARVASINDWVALQVASVHALGVNTSVQLYLTELAAAGGDPARMTDEPGQAGYLANLLLATADRTGFLPPPAPQIPANLERRRISGVAVLDAQTRIRVATPGMPPVVGRLAALAKGIIDPEVAIEDMYLGEGGRPTMAFAIAVYRVHADQTSEPVGYVLGVKDVSGELFALLNRPATVETSDESVLARREGDALVFLSPLLDGTPPLSKRIAADPTSNAEAAALAAAAGFAEGRDYRAADVLAVARPIAGRPWTLVHKIGRAEALGLAETRLSRLFAVVVLAISFIVLAIVAIWRHAASRRAADAADRFEVLARRFESQSRLLRLVTDSQPATIFIADKDGHVRFANKVAATRSETTPAEIIGKTLANVFGAAEARRYDRYMREALAAQSTQASVHRAESDGAPRIVHAEYVPLPASEESPEGVLVVEVEITTAIVERERRERTLHQLVRTLLAVVDRRDPFAAHHSQRVAAVARRVAEEMSLDPALVETAEIAGSLMNLGKILVPAQILTRSSSLTQDERQQIRESLKAGADLLDGVEFDGPVVETLRQAQEHWDGGGPRGIRGVEILVTARIIAVANAFVALASARAHRPGFELDQAVETIMQEAGTIYDRRVVAALLNDIENRGGRRRWAEFATSPARTGTAMPA